MDYNAPNMDAIAKKLQTIKHGFFFTQKHLKILEFQGGNQVSIILYQIKSVFSKKVFSQNIITSQ